MINLEQYCQLGHILTAWTVDSSSWNYKTKQSKKCLEHTAETSGIYCYALKDKFRPQTAGIMCGNGCTISLCVYSRKSQKGNIMQFLCSSTPCPGDDPNYSNTYNAPNKELIVSPMTSYGGSLNETTSGGTSVNIITGANLNSSSISTYLISDKWNFIQWTITSSGLATVYLNGKQYKTGQCTRSCWIGAAVNGCPARQCTGAYRSYRLYDRVLTSTELEKLRTE